MFLQTHPSLIPSPWHSHNNCTHSHRFCRIPAIPVPMQISNTHDWGETKMSDSSLCSATKKTSSAVSLCHEYRVATTYILAQKILPTKTNQQCQKHRTRTPCPDEDAKFNSCTFLYGTVLQQARREKPHQQWLKHLKHGQAQHQNIQPGPYLSNLWSYKCTCCSDGFTNCT